MQIVTLQQGSPEWLRWRYAGIGSSDAALIAAHHGMCEKASWMSNLDALYREKITGIDKEKENMVMRRGKNGEAAARIACEAKIGIPVMPVCGEMDVNPRIRASFDGISFGGLRVVEIKCPADAVHQLAKKGGIVSYYVPQLVHQGLVAWGLPQDWPQDALIHFYTYVPETGDGALVTVRALDYLDYAAALYEHELAFLAQLDRQVPPCGEDYLGLAVQYAQLDAEIKAITKRRDALKDVMIALANKRNLKTLQGGGVLLLQAERAGTIDYARLVSEYSIAPEEVERYRKKSSTFWQIRADKGEAPTTDAANPETAEAEPLAATA